MRTTTPGRRLLAGLLAPPLLLLAACGSGESGIRSGGTDAATSAAPEATETPSESPSDTPSDTPSETATPTTEPTTGGTTIGEYLASLDISQRPIGRRSGLLTLPSRPGWKLTTSEFANYGALVYTGGADAAQPPRVLVLATQVPAVVDPQRVLDLAPNELRALDGFAEGIEPSADTLDGFDAVFYGGSIPSGDAPLLIAQKTVVVPAEVGLVLLQFNAYARLEESSELQAMLDLIDAEAVIDPTAG